MLESVSVQVLDPRYFEEWGMPSFATPGSAAFDLRASISEPLIIMPGQTTLLKTGLRIHIKDTGYAGIILPRSGMGHKRGLVLGNGTGLIDSDYQGDLAVSLTNRKQSFGIAALTGLLSDPEIINPGDRIAQLLFIPIARPTFNVVSSFETSERGEGGFGHTGEK